VTQASSTPVQDIELSELTPPRTPPDAALLPPRLNVFAGVKATVKVVAGEASASVGELLALAEGSVLTLDRAVDAPFDVVLDGVVLARGQLVAVGEQFGIRIVDVCIPPQA
jgi:flagellar motor switch protein FliN/FliY